MKASELQPGWTYVGKNGRRRFIWCLWTNDVSYDVPEGVKGGSKRCSRSQFARWADREATPEESSP